MPRDSLVFALGGAVLLALHTWRLRNDHRRGEWLTHDSGDEPQPVTRADVLLAFALALGLSGYAAYGVLEWCVWTGGYLECRAD